MIGLKNSYEIAYNGTENECRFELYADSAADLQGLTHIDGIKIQIGSECKDIATGDKYILNGSGVWVLQPSANAWENVYTKSDINDMIKEIYGIIAYYHTTLVSDTGEITFYSLGGNVGKLSIYGNCQQTGTPAPDAPIMPTFCGVRTGNLWAEDYTGISANLKYVPVFVGEGTFTLSTDTPDLSRNAPLFLLSGNVTSGASSPVNGVYNGVSRTTDSSNGYITIAFRFNDESTNPMTYKTMLNLGSTALPYEPYGWKIPFTCAGRTVPVYLGQTQTVRRIKKLVLDGTETGWTKNTISENNAYYLSISDYYRYNGICTHYATADNERAETGIFFGGNINFLTQLSDEIDTIDKWKSYLAQQYAAGTPVTVWYVLTEPTTAIVNEPLAKIGDYADELHSEDAGVSIPTIKGSNTLTVDTELKPSRIEIQGGYHA